MCHWDTELTDSVAADVMSDLDHHFFIQQPMDTLMTSPESQLQLQLLTTKPLMLIENEEFSNVYEGKDISMKKFGTN